MKTSDSISKLAPALLAAQKAITFAAKDTANPFFKSKYADLPCVIDAIKGPLNDAGIAFTQSASPSEQGFLAMTTRLIHESGEWIEDTATLPLPKADPQGYGSASTYARRYALAAITGLYQDDDDGNAAQKQPPRAAPAAPKGQKKPGTIDEVKIQTLTSLADEVNADMDALLTHFMITRVEDMPEIDYPKAVKALEKMRSAA